MAGDDQRVARVGGADDLYRARVDVVVRVGVVSQDIDGDRAAGRSAAAVGNADRGGSSSSNKYLTFGSLDQTAAIRSKLISLRINRLDNTQQFDEGMPLIAALWAGTGCGVFEEFVKVTARLEGLGDFLEALRCIADGAISCIGLHDGRNFGVDFHGFARANIHFAAIGQRQNDIRALPGHHAFTLTDRIAEFETAHVTGTVAGESLTGQNGNLGDDVGVSHDDTPDTY